MYRVATYHNYGMFDVPIETTAGLAQGMTVAIRDERRGGFQETFARITWVEGHRIGLDRGLESDYGPDHPVLIASFPLVHAEGVLLTASPVTVRIYAQMALEATVIGHVEHVGLSVSNLERSIGFYRDHLGLQLLRIIEADPALPLGRVVGLPGCLARIAHLTKGQGMLELFEYQRPRGRPIPADRCQCDHGLIHIGFSSTDVRADHQRLSSAGVRFVSDPVEFRPGVWIAYFYGPDGEVCELRQT